MRTSILIRSSRHHDAPFVGGTLWVHLPLERFSAQQTDASGATFEIVPLFAGMAGVTQHFQYWHRDGMHPDGTGAGLSNALQVRYRP